MSSLTRPQQMPGTTRAQLATITTLRQQQPPDILAQQDTNASCDSDINIPDYSVLRKQKLDKINTYYNTLLSSYTQTLRDYNINLSKDANSNKYATTTLQPKVQNYNKQIINLSKEMIKNVDQDTELIMKQKDELTTKTRNIDTLLNNIKLLKEKDNEMAILTKARNDSVNSANTGVDSMNFSTYVFIGINILLILSVIGIVIYIVYSNYTYSSTNNYVNNYTPTPA